MCVYCCCQMFIYDTFSRKSYNNILIGRDFMKLFGSVKFDFESNRVQLGSSWVNGAAIHNVKRVRLAEKSDIPARSEQVVNVRCKNKYALLNVDFEPNKLSGNQRVFVLRVKRKDTLVKWVKNVAHLFALCNQISQP